MKRNFPAVILLLLVGTVVCIQLWPFTLSFRQNADDNLYHYIALGSDPDSMLEYTIAEAESQGRIGKFISAPIKFAVNYLLDYEIVRALVVLTFFLSYTLIFRYIDLLFRTRYLPLAICLTLALIPLVKTGYLPPNGYPLAFTLPFLLFIFLRIKMLPLKWRSHNKGKIILWKLAQLPLILNNEYTIILGAFVAILEAWSSTGSLNTTPQPGSEDPNRWSCRITQAFKRPQFLLDLGILSLAALIYMFFRFANPTTYIGNKFVDSFSVVNTVTVMFKHMTASLSPSYYSSTLLDASQEGIFVAAILSLCMCVLTWRYSCRSHTKQPLIILTVGLIWAIIPTLLVSFSLKYQGQCLLDAQCTHFDSRVAFPGLILAICGLIGLFYQLTLPRSLPEKLQRIGITSVISISSGATFLANNQALDTVLPREKAHRVIQQYACAVPVPSEADRLIVDTVQDLVAWLPIDSQNVSHIPPGLLGESGRRAYMLRYLDYRRNSRFPCAEFSLPTGKVGFSENVELPTGVMMSGWTHPEDWGQWSEGHYSAFILSGQDRKELPLSVSLKLSAFTPTGHPRQRVRFFLNGVPYCNASVGSQPSIFSFAFRSVAEGNQTMVLGLQLPDAISPGAAGGSEDDRVLGVAIYALDISDSMAAPTPEAGGACLEAK